jgi:inhibitor of KinA sporulation pathway (predicted exonuclease)
MPLKLIACDLEATCWEDPARRLTQEEETEIIEIGAVELCPLTYQTLDTFQSLVRPVRHPTLSDYCLDLTGILQEEVDAASIFEEVWPRFRAWLGDLEQVAFCAWGGFDDHQLQQQVEALGEPAPGWSPTNIRVEFNAWCRDHGQDHHRVGLAGALEVLGSPPLTHAHRALHDAKGVGQVIAWVRNRENLSAPTQALWGLIQERAPATTHRGHARAHLAMDKGAFTRARRELMRVGLVEQLGDGQGVQPRTIPDLPVR